LADISNECQATPPLRLDLFDGAVDVVPVDSFFVRWESLWGASGASHYDIGPLGGKRHRSGTPNAAPAPGACHNGHFTVQNSHEVLLCPGMAEER
jgi:hypothetical protein